MRPGANANCRSTYGGANKTAGNGCTYNSTNQGASCSRNTNYPTAELYEAG